jgi:DNA processing protein
MDVGRSQSSSLAATSLRAALLWRPGIGAAAFRDLRTTLGTDSAIAAADAETLRSIARRITEDQARALATASQHVGEHVREVLSLAREGVDVVADDDPSYPSRLLRLSAPPPLLCVRGRMPTAERAVAIVGTRSPTGADCEMARTLALRCAGLGVTVVSGLALGVDTAAHAGAIEGGGQTVAVLGCGISVIYPQRNRGLAERIVRRGALISETSPRAPVSVASLMARNRITAALASAVIVVASGLRGGSLATARHAERLGLQVAAVAWDDIHPKREGNTMLLESGATALHRPEDLDALLSVSR